MKSLDSLINFKKIAQLFLSAYPRALPSLPSWRTKLYIEPYPGSACVFAEELKGNRSGFEHAHPAMQFPLQTSFSPPP